MTVYFVQAEITRRIKIGFTAGAVEKRLASLQTGSGEILTLLSTVPGDKGLEARLHAKFAAYRTHNEWFKESSELWALIDGLPESLAGLPLARAASLPALSKGACRIVVDQIVKAADKIVSTARSARHPLLEEYAAQVRHRLHDDRHGEIVSREQYERTQSLFEEIVGKPQPAYDQAYDYMVASVVVKGNASLLRPPQHVPE